MKGDYKKTRSPLDVAVFWYEDVIQGLRSIEEMLDQMQNLHYSGMYKDVSTGFDGNDSYIAVKTNDGKEHKFIFDSYGETFKEWYNQQTQSDE